ncbi:RING-H2 finger protein ATL79-like [Phalaenopsis equestris]|uniref:RING-H2 finger protein ATL79-like n=1 Tax=Phalaenopsis equestris TaxID=78828 RepID=UPI0009E21999|nr:RING-H2 finger protein ATL79-like [Phalaenopsis equestris]
MLGTGVNLITTVIGFGMSATFIIFICARLICGRIRSSESRAAAFSHELRSDLYTTEHSFHGPEPINVAAIPTMKYCREAFRSKEDAQCSICLGEYEDKEMLRILPACLHNFHLTCIDVWLQKQPTCPICRLPLNVTHEGRLASPFTRSRQIDGDEFSNNHSNARLLPTHHHTGIGGSNFEMNETISVVIRFQGGEHENGA